MNQRRERGQCLAEYDAGPVVLYCIRPANHAGTHRAEAEWYD